MYELAIIIPAFKKKYLDDALASLANQTNKSFTVYIGDDNSPENLYEVVEHYKFSLTIIYHRFENNIGSKKLVNQWNRSIMLSKEEKWLWLFSDDDVAQNNCVEKFYQTVDQKKEKFDIYRFNTQVIDDSGKIIHVTPNGPEEESSEEMAYHLLLGQRGNCMQDHIFSREVYLKNKGIVYTDYAQGADWATSILYSKEKGICIIADAKLYWRYSGSNISSTAYKSRNLTMKGHLQFIIWIIKHFEYLKEASSNVSYNMIVEATRANFRHVLINHYKGYNNNYIIKLLFFQQRVLRLSYFQAFKNLSSIKELTSPTFKKYNSKIRRLKRGLSPS